MGQFGNNVGFRGPGIGDDDNGPGTAQEQVEGLEEMCPSLLVPAGELQLSAGCRGEARTIRCCVTGSATYTPNRPVCGGKDTEFRLFEERSLVTDRLKIVLPASGIHECEVGHFSLQSQQRGGEETESRAFVS